MQYREGGGGRGGVEVSITCSKRVEVRTLFPRVLHEFSEESVVDWMMTMMEIRWGGWLALLAKKGREDASEKIR